MTEPSDAVQQSLRIQTTLSGLLMQLFKRLPKDAVAEVGKELGMIQDNQFVRRTPFDEFFLLEYALYYVSVQEGRNTIEETLASALPEDPEQQAVLRAMAKARYSLFRVERVLPGEGAEVTDLLRGDRLTVHSEVFGKFGESIQGTGILGRILCVESVCAFGSTPLPLAPDHLAACRQVFETGAGVKGWSRDAAHWSRPEEAAFSVSMIRCVRRLRAEAYAHDPDTCDDPSHHHGESAAAGRNDPCPCGSGKKFKKCCGKAS